MVRRVSPSHGRTVVPALLPEDFLTPVCQSHGSRSLAGRTIGTKARREVNIAVECDHLFLGKTLLTRNEVFHERGPAEISSSGIDEKKNGETTGCRVTLEENRWNQNQDDAACERHTKLRLS
jgi:hypothetical protein